MSSDPYSTSVSVAANRISSLTRFALLTDVTDDVAVHAMMQSIVDKYGRLDVVFANAGIAKVQSLLNSNAADRKTMFDVNVHGVMNTCIAAAKSMVAGGIKGRIICTASIVALRPFPMLGPCEHSLSLVLPHSMLTLNSSVDSSSKWAVKGFVQVAAMEFARYGIRVNGICPGIVDSDMWDLIDRELGLLENRAVGETRAKYVQDLVLLGRLSVPDDVAKLASFLASGESEYITGQCMVVDGGVSFA